MAKPARNRNAATSPEQVMSIIGHGMKVVGDCVTTDTVRIEGSVEGSVQADKAVVIGKDGRVTGDVLTQDAVIAGTVTGMVQVHSRLELQSTCKIDGEIHAASLKLDEGGAVNGTVAVGRNQPVLAPPPDGQKSAGRPRPPEVAGRDKKRGHRK